MPERPNLLLYVPGDWDAHPTALDELRRHLWDEYGATLEIRSTRGLPRGPAPLYTGVWRSGAGAELRPWIATAFFTQNRPDLEHVE